MIKPQILMSAQEAVAGAFVGEGITVKWDAEVPHADLKNRVIHLCPLPDQITDESMVDIKADCDHELAHFLYTDPKALDDIGDGYESLIFNAIEDGRIERIHGSKYLGALENLEESNALHIEKMMSEATYDDGCKRARAVTALMLTANGKDLPQVVDTLGEDICPYIDQVSDLLPKLPLAGSTSEVVELAKQIGERWGWVDQGPTTARRRLSPDTELSEVDHRAAKPRANPKMPVAGPGKFAGKPSNAPRLDATGVQAVGEKLIGERRKRNISEMEFVGSASYKAKTEHDVEGTIPAPIMFSSVESVHPEFMKEVRAVAGPLRRRLLMEFRNQGAVDQPNQKSGKIDGRALHRIATGDANIFTKLRRAPVLSRDITLMVDCSSSMLNTPGSFERLRARRRSRLWTAAQAACACSLLLDLIGVPNEVLAWTTSGFADPDPDYDRVTPLYHMVVKPSTKSFHAAQKNFTRLALFEHSADNIDGEALLWGAKRLALRARRSGASPLLIVFSDGEPYSFREQPAILSTHLRDCVRRIEDAGVSTLGIGIQTDEVSHFYPRWATIESLSDMTADFYNLLRDDLRKNKKVR